MDSKITSTKRELTPQQQQRIKDHSVSVVFSKDGAFETKSSQIITPSGLGKLNKQISVVPSDTEKVVPLGDVPCYFDDLTHVNVILTNACNLSCTYCYEQHNKDFGRFTPDSLKEIYDFLVNVNDVEGKLFQFFGGEPLIHKPLILEFIRKYHEDLEKNRNGISVSMITNGILLDKKFIDEFFSHKFSNMSVSLDTINAEIDHREIGQDRIDEIIENIGHIPAYHKDQHQFSIRCTLSVETAPELLQFATRLFEQGVRAMVIHPLTMSSVDGFIKWPDAVWEKLHTDIVTVIETFPNFEIQFSEGVGLKKANNCMVGSDMIAVDGSGDYSGCYFFTNHKETAGHTMLGNLLKKQVYVDRYAGFQQEYDKMFEEYEQCKTCDLQKLCYQCPAGNMDTGDGKMFRPDDMCQDIVRLFLTLQNDIVKKSFKLKLDDIISVLPEMGEQRLFAKAITYLMYKRMNGVHLPVEYLDDKLDDLPDYKTILGYFMDRLESGAAPFDNDMESYFTDIAKFPNKLNIKDFYNQYIDMIGVSNSKAQQYGDINDVTKRAFFLTLLHLVVLNSKGDKLN